ncbi:MAG: hypothetical protein R2795_26115 [Saprospiraceae bacterium]
MKHIYKFYFFALVFSCAGTLRAQIPTHLGPLLELLTEQDEANFNTELGQLSDSLFYDQFDGLRIEDFDLGIAHDSLFYYLNNDTIINTDSLVQVWLNNGNDLDMWLGSGDVSSEDSTALNDEFDRLNEIWFTDHDSLNTVIDTYQDTLQFTNGFNTEDFVTCYEVFIGPLYQSFDLLETEYWPSLFTNTPNQGIDSLKEVLDTTLFDDAYDFEIAYGQEWSSINFWGEQYDLRANLIRIATVPKFNQTFETRWSLEGSFFLGEDAVENRGEIQELNFESGVNAFICNANFAMMYLPRFNGMGGTADFRLYTSIGVDAGTYVPSHIDLTVPAYANRIGKTTGWGPELGFGFIIDFQQLFTLYSYGTIARGNVINGFDYKYHSATINAGIRYNDAINVRYTLGESSWAPNDQKNVRYSRFTVGVILDSLRR